MGGRGKAAWVYFNAHADTLHLFVVPSNAVLMIARLLDNSSFWSGVHVWGNETLRDGLEVEEEGHGRQ